MSSKGPTDLASQIETMSDEQLTQMRELVETETRKRASRRARDARKQIVELAHQHNIDLSTLAGKAEEGPKYRDPANQFNTWSGRGRKPDWLRKYVAEGRDIEEFRIS
ncbi:H-NS histone family protein [Caballeronia sp. TF1N1]|uniref:H-NS histone family protein n=1 Tax=Caballeronia sp. TF1N1 TaxID=2878153 RepID=UPI00272E502B|nr:H-NS histone family protein [Caballeronia sp. TF1N1]